MPVRLRTAILVVAATLLAACGSALPTAPDVPDAPRLDSHPWG